MSILDKIKDKVNDVSDIEDKIKDVTGLMTKNQSFAEELFNFLKMPNLNITETVTKLFAENVDQDFVKKIQKEVSKFLLKNPKLMKEVLKLVSKFQ